MCLGVLLSIPAVGEGNHKSSEVRCPRVPCADSMASWPWNDDWLVNVGSSEGSTAAPASRVSTVPRGSWDGSAEGRLLGFDGSA
jgi:hypothetical protein